MKKYKRWNGKRKAEVAMALLKGEPLEEASLRVWLNLAYSGTRRII